MLTKYYIEIDGQKVEIPKECIKNWDEIQCAYKRVDFNGITRSFTHLSLNLSARYIIC